MGQLVCARLWGAVNEIPLYGGVAEGLGGHDITYLRIIPIFFTPIFAPTTGENRVRIIWYN